MNCSVANVLPAKPAQMAIMPSVGTPWVDNPEEKPGDIFEVISVGRFVPLKGFDLTISAFAAFYHNLPQEKRSQVRLRLIGKGPLLNQMKLKVEELAISDAVVFVEWIEKEKLAAFYQQANVFLFPSHEGAGMVVAEAMSYGLPVVCLENCGPGEFVTPDSGLTIPYQGYDETIAELAEGLTQLYKNESERNRLATGARFRFETHFNWDAKGEHLRSMYQELLQTA
jgi:glycosyltransferase involved in cell wall biosynthesis